MSRGNRPNGHHKFLPTILIYVYYYYHYFYYYAVLFSLSHVIIVTFSFVAVLKQFIASHQRKYLLKLHLCMNNHNTRVNDIAWVWFPFDCYFGILIDVSNNLSKVWNFSCFSKWNCNGILSLNPCKCLLNLYGYLWLN